VADVSWELTASIVITLIMEAVSSHERLVNISQTAWCDITEGNNHLADKQLLICPIKN
jgi:hypothetical protein